MKKAGDRVLGCVFNRVHRKTSLQKRNVSWDLNKGSHGGVLEGERNAACRAGMRGHTQATARPQWWEQIVLAETSGSGSVDCGGNVVYDWCAML